MARPNSPLERSALFVALFAVLVATVLGQVSVLHGFLSFIALFAVLIYRHFLLRIMVGDFPMVTQPLPKRPPIPEGSDELHDVIIIGSGVAGSTLATCLAKMNVRVLMFDAGVHPKFALGESMHGESNLWFKILANRYEIPELLYNSSFRGTIARVGNMCGLKLGFGFVRHEKGQKHKPEEASQLAGLNWGIVGPDQHHFRETLDYYLFQTAIKYGVVGKQNEAVTTLNFDNPDYVEVKTSRREGPVVKELTYRGKYLIDASSFTSMISKHFNLRDDSPLLLHSRCIFNHFIDLQGFDNVSPESTKHMATSFHSQTTHHYFDGGWIWIIPFCNTPKSCNRLTSVGACLDPKYFPYDPKVSPEQEWENICKMFPSIGEQFKGARAVRPWGSTGPRLQYFNKQTVGDRWAMLPAAAGNIDAFWSNGLFLSLEVVSALSGEVIQALKDGDLSRKRFQHIEDLTKGLTLEWDQFVYCTYVCFRDSKLWVTWMKFVMLTILHGGTRKVSTLLRYVESGDRSILDNMHKTDNQPSPYTRAPLTVGWTETFASIRDLIIKVDKGEKSYEEARQFLKEIMRNGKLCPNNMGFDDDHPAVNVNNPTYYPTFLIWGKGNAVKDPRMKVMFSTSPFTFMGFIIPYFFPPKDNQIF